MSGRARGFSTLVMGVGLGLYLLNTWVLKPLLPPPFSGFFICYFNDVVAGACMLAFVDFWLTLWGFRPLAPFWKQGLFLLAAGAVWEFGPMIWKPLGVFDPWDFAAYIAGGIGYWLLCRRGEPTPRE